MQMYRDTSDHGLCLSEYIYMYVCIYLSIYLCISYIYIHIHIQRDIRDNWRSLEMSRDIDR